MKEVTAHLQKAHEKLHAARALLNAGHAGDSISRAYYAAFHAATAALMAAGETPKTHKGTHMRFWVRFVQSGQFPEHLGGLLTHAQEIRERADYDAMTRFDATAAGDLLADMEAFVTAAEALVRELDGD